MQDFSFGLASRADAGEILALYRSRIGSPGCAWSLEYPDEETLEEDLTVNELFTARDDTGVIWGVLTVAREADLDFPFWNPAVKNPFEPMRLGVRPDGQGKGVAHALFDFVIARKKAEGYDGLHFLVSPKNPRALRLYERMGFSCAGEANMHGMHWYCYEGRI